jgi:hypothetical protein
VAQGQMQPRLDLSALEGRVGNMERPGLSPFQFYIDRELASEVGM